MAIIDCWGVEAGLVVANTGPDVIGGVPTAVSPPAGFGHGNYCLRINPAPSTAMYVEWTRITPATLALGFSLKVDSFGSSSSQGIIEIKAFGTASASKFIHFGLDGSTKKLYFQNAAGTKLVDPTVRAITDVLWVDLLFDFSGATWAYNWAVNGTPLAAITGDSQVASSVNYIAAGLVAGNAGPYSAYLDDFVFGDSAADFNMYSQNPRVLPLEPRAGAGSIDTTNSVNLSKFHDEATVVAGADSGGSISSGAFGAVSRFIAWDGASPGTTDKAVAFMYDTPETIPAKILRAYAQFKNSDGSASVNTFKVAATSGGTVTNLFNGSVASGTSKYRSALLTAPGGGWSVTNVNALEAFWGAGTSNNNAGAPALENFIAEALYMGTSASITFATRTGTVAKDTTGTATTLPITVPSGVQDGELLVAVLVCADTTPGITMPAPAGWTQRTFLISSTGGGQTIGVFTKPAVAADASSTINFTITGSTSGTRQMIGVICSVLDSGTGASITVDSVANAAEDTVGPALDSPAFTAPSSVPAALLSFVAVDQSAGTAPSWGTVTTDSGGTVTKLVDDAETGTVLILGVAVEIQAAPVSAIHTFNYTGGGTSTRGGALAGLVAVVSSGATNPPATPTGLTVTSFDDDQVTLSWNPNADGRASFYNIYRDGALVGSSSSTTFQDTPVNASTTYVYTLTAVDSSGNESGQTAGVSVTTTALITVQVGGLLQRVRRTVSATDSVPPSIPQGVTASPQSSSSITVSWSPSSDNVGVVGYRVRRSSTGVLLTSVSAGITSWTQTGLAAATTYGYTVEAFDAAGNTSAISSVATAQTLAAAGSTTWEQQTAYVRAYVPPTPLRTIVCSTFAEFQSAWNAAQPGDFIDCTNAIFTYTNEFVAHDKNGTQAHPIVVQFGPSCLFSFTGANNSPALWFYKNSWVHWLDGKYTTNSNGGQGMLVTGCHDVIQYFREWNGSKVYNCGRDGAMVCTYFSGSTPIALPYTYKGVSKSAGNYRLDQYFGEITQCGLGYNIAGYDPHPIKGTGLHGIQYADSFYANYDCRLAAYIHDQPTGAAIQAGGSNSTDGVIGGTILLKAVNITNVVNAPYGNGSALQFWGQHVEDNVISYLEATACAGRAVNAEGMSNITSGLATDVVQYGRAVGCCYKMAAGTNPWDTRAQMQYVDIASS